MKKKPLLTHPDAVLFPKSGITKRELAEYYIRVAPKMLPHLRQRPISMARYPQGIKEEGFFQKQISEELPKGIHTANVKRKDQPPIQMLLCEKKETLMWLVNHSCITPHIWLSRIDKPHFPDRMIFDLDPPHSKHFSKVIDGALILRDILEKKHNLTSFVLATGSQGLHVMVPLRRKYDFDIVRAFARSVAEEIAQQLPKQFTTAVRKEARKNRIYIDVMRNGYAQTAVAPYAVRALEDAPIAMPIFWEELQDKSLRSDGFTLRNSQARLRKTQAWEHLPLCSLPRLRVRAE